MPTSTAAWASVEGEREAFDDGDEDLAGTLESYTRQLGDLCGGLEVQQLEAEDEDATDVEPNTDTLTSLEEMSSECAALLACLEAGEKSGSDNDDPETLEESAGAANQSKEEQTLLEPPCHERLSHELDIFADELQHLAFCLLDSTSLKESGVLSVVDIGTEEPSADSATPSIDAATCQNTEGEPGKTNENDASASAASAGEGEYSKDNKPIVPADEANAAHQREVFNERTKNAIVLHVKRLAKQKQRRSGSRNQVQASTSTKNIDPNAEEHRNAGVKIVWSKFQSTSFQQHISRQKFARRRVQQIQEVQHLVESARLRGAVSSLQTEASKSRDCKSQVRAQQNARYLDQFTPTSTNSLPQSELEPRYLCAIYLYGLRHLGTTYITFSSLAQFEQRARARFAIQEVVSIYREVTEVVLPEPNMGRRQPRNLKRLQRISSLEHVNDGDTLCITQNAYDDMTILCDWIKRRQRIVHGFQYEVRKAPSVATTFPDDTLSPPMPKSSSNCATQPQLWDSNGRTIGVKVHHDI